MEKLPLEWKNLSLKGKKTNWIGRTQYNLEKPQYEWTAKTLSSLKLFIICSLFSFF